MPADRALPTLSQPEFASLIVLMAVGRELTNPQLKELAGFSLTGKERRTLNELKLVESRKEGRALVHRLTEDGWLAGREVLATPRPPRAGSFGGALFALLAGIAAGLDRHALSPAQFFDPRQSGRIAPPDLNPQADHISVASPFADADASTDATAGGDSPESAIRAAYAKLAAVPGDWIGLAALRAELGTLSRADVDQALKSLIKQRDVRIIPVANLKSLTQEDRDAGIRIGGQDRHALAIEAG